MLCALFSKDLEMLTGCLTVGAASLTGSWMVTREVGGLCIEWFSNTLNGSTAWSTLKRP